jgi:hypothetical protein
MNVTHTSAMRMIFAKNLFLVGENTVGTGGKDENKSQGAFSL